jgi:flagellar biogenesis protein FliO
VIRPFRTLQFKLVAGPRWVVFSLFSAFLAAGSDATAQLAGSTNVSTVSTVSTLSGGLPDTGASVIRVFGALMLVVGIFLGGVWLFRNWQRFTVQKGGGPRLNVLEARSLGQRQSLYVVGYQQQRLLLAASPAGITLLSHLPPADEKECDPAAVATKISFADAFQQVLARKQ